MKNSNKTKQITEIIFNKEVNPFVSKKITENALGTCSYFENLNKEKIKGLSHNIETEYEDNPKSPDETKITKWLTDLKEQENNAAEWKETGEMILKTIVAVYPDYVPRSSAKVVESNKADLLKEARARFAK